MGVMAYVMSYSGLVYVMSFNETSVIQERTPHNVLRITYSS